MNDTTYNTTNVKKPPHYFEPTLNQPKTSVLNVSCYHVTVVDYLHPALHILDSTIAANFSNYYYYYIYTHKKDQLKKKPQKNNNNMYSIYSNRQCTNLA